MPHQPITHKRHPNRARQGGVALLLLAFLIGFVMLFGAWAINATSNNVASAVPQSVVSNQARQNALAALNAMAQYFNQKYCGNFSGSTPCSTGNTSNVTPYLPPSGSTSINASNLPAPLNGSATARVLAYNIIPASATTPPNITIEVASQGTYRQAFQVAHAVLLAQQDLSTTPSNAYQMYLSGQVTLNGGITNGAPGGGLIQVGVAPGTTIKYNGSNDFQTTNISANQMPIVTTGSFVNYASVKLNVVYPNGTAQIPAPTSCSTCTGSITVVDATNGVSAGTYAIPSLQADALGIAYDPGTNAWTVSKGSTALIYAEGNVNLGYTGSAYQTVVATGTITTDYTSNGQTINTTGASPNVCNSIPQICQGGMPLPLFVADALASDGGLVIYPNTTINGSIGSNGTIFWYGGGGITIAGAIVADQGVVNTGTEGSTISLLGNGKGTVIGSSNASASNFAFTTNLLRIAVHSLRWLNR